MEQYNTTMEVKGLELQTDRTQFALALKTWRLRAGLTQKEVGAQWGCSRYTIIRAEAGQPIAWQMAYKLFVHLQRELLKEAKNEVYNDNRH